MGAVIKLNYRKYELEYQQFYSQGRLNLKNDEISKEDAVKYILKLQHRNHMRSILNVVK